MDIKSVIRKMFRPRTELMVDWHYVTKGQKYEACAYGYDLMVYRIDDQWAYGVINLGSKRVMQTKTGIKILEQAKDEAELAARKVAREG